jgi:D-alanyl-lipoteichoic acid acyltransferase DltB (MBOAT superfamily)
MELISPYSAAFAAAGAGGFPAPPPRWRAATLSAVSLSFCALVSSAAAVALATATGFTYLIGRALDGSRGGLGRGSWLSLGVLVLFGHLVAVKTAGAAALGNSFTAIVVAGFGASYYTFKLLSYLLDVYWRRYPAWSSAIDFLACVTFFPQMPAGPIQRPSEFVTTGWTLPDAEQLSAAFRRILLGLMKKLLVADQLASITAPIAAAQPAQWHLVWLLAYLYPIQLYADFSGLADIAIGCAALFGIRSPENFDHPFFVYNISTYWRKWHMTLTRWLGDYVFTPLRMATRNLGNGGLVLSICMNMVLIGLWHAITVGCLLFGVAHGIFLSLDALTTQWRRRLYRRRPGAAAAARALGPVIVYHMVAFALLIFGTTSVHEAARLLIDWVRGLQELGSSIGELFAWVGRRHCLYVSVALTAFVAYELAGFARANGRGGTWRWIEIPSWPRPVRWAGYYAAIALIMLGRGASSRFIYVRF